MSETWSIIVHGGAGLIKPERREAKRAATLAAVQAGAVVLAAGGTAVEAVVAAVRLMEDDPHFNAGFGAVLNADRRVELDSALMDGATLDLGGVAAVQGVKNPIEVAHLMLRDEPVLLAGDGARRYAAEKGAAMIDPEAMIAPHRRTDDVADTVGCVVFDVEGNFAAGTSTGGRPGKRPGRIGDSPIPGAGLYAQNGVGAVSLSGEGELILRRILGARLVADLETTDAATAADRAIGAMGGQGGVGCIVLGADGGPAFAHNAPDFAVAMEQAGKPARAFLNRGEWQGD